MNEEDWVKLLREAHREPVDPAHYAAVRARVLAELSRERHPFGRQGWIWGLAAAAVLMVTMIPRPVGRTGAPTASVGPSAFLERPAPVYGPAAPLPDVAEKMVAPVRHRRPVLVEAKEGRRTHRCCGRPGPPHLEPVTIKLLTDDPDVIIYWIADGEGE
jgi:hypothetical protein